MLLRRERIVDVLPQLDSLITSYWFASVENEGHEPLNFDWLQYMQLETAHRCILFTARDPDTREMIGAALYLVIHHLHHQGYLMANCDTLCTAIKHRGKGIGRQLVEFAAPQLKAMGVREIIHMARHVYDTSHLFPKLGFTAIETVYSKKVA